MSEHKADIVIHPHRLRILQSLVNRPRTTQEIAEALPDIPKSSIYRHLKKMLDAGVIAVTDTHQVRGVQEKVYVLTKAARLTPDDLSSLSAEDHARLFASYTATLLQAFSEYLNGAETIDFFRDRVGYTEVAFYATTEEFDAVATALNQAVIPLLQNGPGGGRHKRKFATITHPILNA